MWNGPTFQSYYLQIDRIIAERLAKEQPEYLLQVDPQQYLDYLVSEAEWQPLEWDEGQLTVEPFTAKVERYDQFDERKYVSDVSQLRLRIPTSLHPQRTEYFRFGPSTTRLTSEPKWKFEGSILVLDVEASEQAIERGLDDVRFWLGGRNKDIEGGNRQLRERIRPVWESKRRQLEQQHSATQAVLQKVNIRLHQDPDARAKPVEIRPRQLRTVVDKPQASAAPEPALKDEDVAALVDFIERYARQFEVAPQTYAKMGEEELRNLLVGMINTNYPGSTTAETFNKLGKTDISLRVEGGHVLIAECKFWPGVKEYAQALEQLFGYLTWRQNYGVLITFCRLRDMSKAVAAAKQAMQTHASWSASSTRERSATRFSTRHLHPQDAGKSVEVHHLFFDLSI